MKTENKTGCADIKLWENGTPGFLPEYGQPETTFTPYFLENGAKDNACVIVCPGGAYSGRAYHEGEPIARMLNEKGVSAVVLNYRVFPYKYPFITEDLLRTIRFLRHHAADYGLDPKKIGVLGFSSGGHLAASSLCCFDYGKQDDADPIEKESSRPDFAVLCYAVISFDKYMHANSRIRLIGGLPDEAQLAVRLSPKLSVREDTPPVFLWHTMDDEGVDARNSLNYALALRSHNIPCELHIFQHGHHGVGLAADYHNVWQWPELLSNWMIENGWISQTSALKNEIG